MHIFIIHDPEETDHLYLYPATGSAGHVPSFRETGYIAAWPARIPIPVCDPDEFRPPIERKIKYSEASTWQK
jgi:hypothetical protein